MLLIYCLALWEDLAIIIHNILAPIKCTKEYQIHTNNVSC